MRNTAKICDAWRPLRPGRCPPVCQFVGRLAGRLMVAPLAVALALVALLIAPSRPAQAEVAAWIVVDMESGAVLDQQAARRQWYPASITKLMTAYLAFKAMRDGRAEPTSVVTVSANAHSVPPSKIGLKPGSQVTLDAALKMVIVKSANDMAVAVAEAIAGSEPAFIALMNEEARRLGMTATRFANPHGLPDDAQVSSARDLAVLARALWREFPEHRHYFQLEGIRVGKSLLRSANREFLGRVAGANGMKTGYVCNSGLNVVVSATRGGRTVLAVVLGAASGVERAAKARVLIEDGFRKRSGRSLDELAGIDGGPPAAGYCKRNPRPTAEELLAAFGPRETSRPVLSLAAGGVTLPPALQGAAPVVQADDDAPATEDGKTDWGKVMDEIIGPRQRVAEPVQVSLAVPAGARPPRPIGAPAAGTLTPVAGAATGAAAGAAPAAADIPLPLPKPIAALAGEPQSQPAAGAILVPAAPAPAQPASPGSIFRGEPLLIVPRPLAAPRP